MARAIRFFLHAGLVALTSPAFSHPVPDLPSLGEEGGGEVIQVSSVYPGVEYFRIEKGRPDEETEWLISFGVSRNVDEYGLGLKCAGALEASAEVRPFVWPGKDSVQYEEITVGKFRSRDEAKALLDSADIPDWCNPRVTASPMYPSQLSGPWLLHVVEIDPARFDGNIAVAKGDGSVAGRKKVSDITSANNAIVGVNGGYFVMEPSDGVVGEPAGLSIFSGKIQSEPSRDRPWFYFPQLDSVLARLGKTTREVTPRLVWSDGHATPVDGVNRYPRLLRNCGSIAQGTHSISWHDETCFLRDQLIVLTEDAGFTIEPHAGHTVAIIDDSGRPTASKSGRASAGQFLLVATGSRQKELADRIATGATVSLSVPLVNRFPSASAVAGGPTLLRDATPVRQESTEGWPFMKGSRDQATAMHRFVVLRAPRTAIGVRADGTILLLLVDGWRFTDDRTAPLPLNGGVSIEELRLVMADLGAIDAINLDGGGSSALIIEGQVVNHPSDPDGERAIGDAVLVIPPAAGW